MSSSLHPHTKLSVMENQLADDLLEIYVFSESPFKMVTAQVYSSSFKFRVNLSSSLHPPTQNCQWWMINWQVTYWKAMGSVRAHLKLLKFTPQVYLFTCSIHGVTSSTQCGDTFKFTARVTFKFTTRVTFRFTATARVTFKFTARLTFKFTPQSNMHLWNIFTCSVHGVTCSGQ